MPAQPPPNPPTRKRIDSAIQRADKSTKERLAARLTRVLERADARLFPDQNTQAAVDPTAGTAPA